MAEKTHTITIGRDETKQVKIPQSGKYVVVLAGPGAHADIFGVFSAADKDEVRVEVIIHHQAPHTSAETMLRAVARDKSKVYFTGRIIIDENCGDTNSFLTERVLLLSDQAYAEAVPDLEILSDDVKCSHAASISHLPADQIFYLMSRGISRTQAEDMIVEGFLHDEH